MTVTTNEFAAGDTDYIANLNLLHDAIVELQGAGGGSLSLDSVLAMSTGLFGATNICRIGSGSYTAAEVGDILRVEPGEAWLPTEQACVADTSQTDIDFNGYAADTYYVHIDDETGEPFADALDTSDYIYEVVWSGSAFTSVTDTADEVPGFEDWGGLGSGALWSTSYTIPERIDAIENMAALMRVVPVTGATVELDEDEALQQDSVLFTGTPSAAVTATVPDKVRSYIVFNKTDSEMTFTAGAGTTLDVPAGRMGIFYTDGATNVTGVLVIDMDSDEFLGGGGGGGSTASEIHPIPMFISGTTGDAGIFNYSRFSHNVTLPADLTGSYAVAETAATASTVFTIKKNGSSVGTITFAAAATTGVISFSTETVFTKGLDIFELHGPATADATLANIGISIKGYKPATLSYTAGAFLPSVMADGQMMYYGTPTDTFTVAAGGTDCYAVSVTTAAADTTILLKKNGTTFGSVLFGTGLDEGVFTVAVETEIVAGTDIFSIEGPATADTALSGISIAIKGTREG